MSSENTNTVKVALSVLTALIVGATSMFLVGPKKTQETNYENIASIPQLVQRINTLETEQKALKAWKEEHSGEIQHTDTIQCGHIAAAQAAINSHSLHFEYPIKIPLIECGDGAGK